MKKIILIFILGLTMITMVGCKKPEEDITTTTRPLPVRTISTEEGFVEESPTAEKR